MAFPNGSNVSSSDLARFDEAWTKMSAPTDEVYGDIPDGSYDAVIEDTHLSETLSTGRPIVVWKLRIKGPVAYNRLVTKNRVITDKTLEYLREDLEKCGIHISRLSELPGRFSELKDRPIGVDKRTKDGHTNFFFRWDSNKGHNQGITDGDVPF